MRSRFVSIAVLSALSLSLTDAFVVVSPSNRASFDLWAATAQASAGAINLLDPNTNGKSSYKKMVATGMLDVNAVAAGGYNTLYNLADGSPKEKLLNVLSSMYSESESIASAPVETIEALVAFLASEGKGFDKDLVDGEWALLYSKSSKKSPKLQKLIGKSEKVKKTFSNFDSASLKFENVGYTPRSNGVLKATVEYKPTHEGFSKSSTGNIIVRRVTADIVGASFKYRSLPRLPLPIRAKGGYLDFVYLDKDLRITRGNRGGLFIHVRPSMLDEIVG